MTTQKSFSENMAASPNKRFFNTRFFKFKLKTGWPLFVVFAFVFILSMAVPSVSFITETDLRYDTITYQKSMLDNAVEFLYAIGTVNVVISMLLGLLAGLTCMGYTNKKTAVNFYHSLPMRREALFLTSTCRGFLYYIVSFTAGLILMFTAFSVRLGSPGLFVRPILMTLEYGVLFFFLLYAMTLFAASLTGTGFMRFVGAGYVVFLPVALFELFIITIDVCGIGETILNVDYYMNLRVITALFAPARLYNLTGTDENGRFILTDVLGKDIAIVLITAIVLYAVAFLLYRIRPSESASKTIIWRPAAFVFKYATMFMGGSVFGLIFMGIFSSVIWMAFGIIFGSFVTFMFVNGILHKSARAIFRGLKGFFIFMAVMAVVTAVFYMDVFGMFTKVPDGSFVNRVQLNLGGDVHAEYSGDLAEKITNMIDRNCTNDPYERYYYNGEEKPLTEIYSDVKGEVSDAIYSGYTYAGYGYDSIVLEAVFHTKIGIPYAVQIYTNCEEIHELAEFVYATEKSAQTLPILDEVNGGHMELYFGAGDSFSEEEGWNYFNLSDRYDELLDMAGRLYDPFGTKNDSPIVGCIFLDTNNYNTDDDGIYSYIDRIRRLYITAKDYEVLNEMKAGKKFQSEDEVIQYFIDMNDIDELYVVNNGTYERIHLTDTDSIFAMMKAMYSFSEYSYDPALCTKDHTYNIFPRIKTGGDEYNYMAEDYYFIQYNFRKDAVPEFVAEFFSTEE